MVDVRAPRRRSGRSTAAAPPAPRVPVALLDEVTVAVLALHGDDLVYANAAAHRLGVVRGAFLVVAELRQVARLVRRDGVRRTLDLTVPAADLSGRIPVHAQVFLLGGDEVGVVIADQTETARVEAVRREFVASVGHEVKTPVGAIAVLAEALAEARDDPAAVEHFAGRISEETQRLSHLVHELLELSRVQGGEPLPRREPLSTTALVAEVVDRFGPNAAAARVRLVIADADAAHVVLGDHGQLGMALGNLVDNAIAYSRAGAEITIGTRLREDVVEITVTDTGIGIAPADLPRVFERFFRVDPARSRATGGSGLGLAIVKHVMSNHGGEVTVSSRLERGSTFTLRLPVAATKAVS